MENYLLVLSFPFMVSPTPGFALFFHVGQDFKGWSLLFIPILLSHGHLKQQMCLRPVITWVWREPWVLLTSLAWRGALRRATEIWELAPATSAWTQSENPEVISWGAASEKNVSLFLGFHLSSCFSLYSSSFPFAFPLKHLTFSHAILNTIIRRVLLKYLFHQDLACDP